jgi:preprotein translocase subunit SecG
MILAIILASVDILISTALTAAVILQEGNDRGLGVIGGGADTFYNKEKGRTLDSKLKKLTLFLAVSFAVVTIVLFRIIASGF